MAFKSNVDVDSMAEKYDAHKYAFGMEMQSEAQGAGYDMTWSSRAVVFDSQAEKLNDSVRWNSTASRQWVDQVFWFPSMQMLRNEGFAVMACHLEVHNDQTSTCFSTPHRKSLIGSLNSQFCFWSLSISLSVAIQGTQIGHVIKSDQTTRRRMCSLQRYIEKIWFYPSKPGKRADRFGNGSMDKLITGQSTTGTIAI